MQTRSFLMLAALTLTGGLAAGQEQPKIATDRNGQITVTPEMAEWHRKRMAVLEATDSFVFRITLREEGKLGDRRLPSHDANGTRFKAGEEVVFALWVTNTTAEPFKIILYDTYQSDRPQLFKDGELLPYSEKAVKTLEERKIIWSVVSARSALLKPNQAEFVGYFDPKYWYKPLGPGKYRLLLKHSLDPAKSFELPPVDFEVVP